MSGVELQEAKAVVARLLAAGRIKVQRSCPNPTPSRARKTDGLVMTKAAIKMRERRAAGLA